MCIRDRLNHKIDGGGLKFDWFSPNNRHRMGIYTSAQNIDRDSYFGTDKNPCLLYTSIVFDTRSYEHTEQKQW